MLPPEADEITESVTGVTKALALIGSYDPQIAELRALHPLDVICAVETKEGMAQAIAARRAYREPRIALDKAREAAKAPVLELGRKIDALARRIREQLVAGEIAYDGQVKAEEARIEAEKERRRQEEIAALEAVRARIRIAFLVPSEGQSSAQLSAIVEAYREADVAPYGDLAAEASTARDEAIARILAMMERAAEREAEIARLEQEKARLAEERAAFLVQQREEQAQRKIAKDAEDARLAEERERRAAQIKAEDEARAKDRAELDARLAEVQKREAEQRLARQAAEREAQEKAAAAQRKRDEEQRQESERRTRIENAAPAMLEALIAWGTGDVDDDNERLDKARSLRDAAVAAALGIKPDELRYVDAAPKKRTRKIKA